jgi:hypothetical protein
VTNLVLQMLRTTAAYQAAVVQLMVSTNA